MGLPDLLPKLAFGDYTYLKEVAPGTHAFGYRQATSRVRAYQSAQLSPFPGRGIMQEMVLVGHVHVQDGLVTRLEGFNGGEGMRWAQRAQAEIAKAGLLAPDAVVNPTAALRACKDAKNAAVPR